MIVKNILTGRIYEAVLYSYENFKACRDFIREYRNVSVYATLPNMSVYGLKPQERITHIKPSDYIIRTATGGAPLYNTVTAEVMERNFVVIKE